MEELEQRASARDGVIGERSKDSEVREDVPVCGVRCAQAADLYWMGAAAERNGDMGGGWFTALYHGCTATPTRIAVMYYRQAMQLVPDIEFRASSMRPSEPPA